MTTTPRVSRRAVLASAAAIGGGLALGFRIPFEPTAAHAGRAQEINAWIVIRPDQTVIIRFARAEMGQGSLTALPMLVAEELACDWAKVTVEQVAPHENLRRERAWGDMSTSASRAVSASQDYLRRAGATAREMLITAAAGRWGVLVSECSAENSIITHEPSRRTLTFGDVAEAAAAITPPAHVKLKDAKDWKLIGTPQHHFDAPDKVNGKLIYGIDVRVPNMLYAAIVQSPVFNGTVRAVDDTALPGHAGVRRIVQIPHAVAIVAERWWQAKRAADALQVTWDPGDGAAVSSSTIYDLLDEGLAAADAGIGRKDGDVALGLAQAVTRIAATYSVPYLAHATMEPQNCTAHITADGVEIWAPTQDGALALATAADAAGVPPSKVVVHTTMLGGGFGRRGTIQDYVRQAVLIAKEIGQPVKLVWTREQDIQHDFYRPVAAARMTAGLDAGGMPIAWKTRIAGQSIVASMVPSSMRVGTDRSFMQGFLDEMAYAVPNYLVDFAMRPTPVPVGLWRAANYSQNAFFIESFIDEMAHAAGRDSYQFRRKLLQRNPRHLAVLDAAAKRADWNASPPPGRFRGIAMQESANTVCAQVVEASVSYQGAVRVHRVVSAIDPGYAVNPLTIEQQTEGAIVYGLTAALYGEIEIKDGRVAESNFNDYRMLRMSEMPEVVTVIVASGGIWGGCGEPPLPPLAPALCNAVFAATGKRVRSLPLKNHDLRSA
jgi:isoquinoline 1-oxidoreductase subunit beta